MYEGAPTYPYPNRWWSMIEKYGITILYTAPTAIRGLMRFGEAWPNRHDLSSLRLLGIGRRADQPRGLALVSPRHRQGPLPDHGHVVADRNRDVHDHAAARDAPQARQRHAPFPGVEADVVDEGGQAGQAGEEGFLVLKTPVAGDAADDLQDPDRYVQQYWSKYPGRLLHRRSARARTRTATSGSSAAWTT